MTVDYDFTESEVDSDIECEHSSQHSSSDLEDIDGADI
jgi:hypothetical protein